MRQSELVAILDGGDWADASVNFVKVPLTVDIEKERLNYDKWYREVYLPQFRHKLTTYLTFSDWLRKHCGASEPLPTDIEVLDE